MNFRTLRVRDGGRIVCTRGRNIGTPQVAMEPPGEAHQDGGQEGSPRPAHDLSYGGGGRAERAIRVAAVLERIAPLRLVTG